MARSAHDFLGMKTDEVGHADYRPRSLMLALRSSTLAFWVVAVLHTLFMTAYHLFANFSGHFLVEVQYYINNQYVYIWTLFFVLWKVSVRVLTVFIRSRLFLFCFRACPVRWEGCFGGSFVFLYSVSSCTIEVSTRASRPVRACELLVYMLFVKSLMQSTETSSHHQDPPFHLNL